MGDQPVFTDLAVARAVLAETQLAGRPAVVAEITGEAYICGLGKWLIDERDTLTHGFNSGAPCRRRRSTRRPAHPTAECGVITTAVRQPSTTHPMADDAPGPFLYLARMSYSTTPRPAGIRRATRTAVVTVAVGLLLATAACSSSDTAANGVTSSTPTPSTSPPQSTAQPPTATAPTTVPATTAPATTAPATNEAMRSLLTGILASHLTANEFVGARMAVLDASGGLTEVTAGTTTNEPGSAPVDPDEAWNVGSVTKMFVAVIVMQLAEEGRIDLDAGIQQYLPDLADAARITPRQLLQHTSGLNEYLGTPGQLADPMRAWSPAELIGLAESAGRVGEPGGPFNYSNTNYVVLGQIIEQVTGHAWAEEMQSRIVAPLGMTHTSLLTSTTSLPVGYRFVDGAFVDATSSSNSSLGGAAGGVQSTTSDLLRFLHGLLDGALVSDDSLKAMLTFVPGADLSQFDIVNRYGLGVEQYDTGAIVVNGHMGTGESQSAFLGYDVQHGTAVVVMTNAGIAGPQAFMALEALTGASELAPS